MTLIDGTRRRYHHGRMGAPSVTVAAFLALVCVGCSYDYWPAPRGPRTLCSGTAMGQSYGYQEAAWGQSSCEHYPADTCHPDSESYQEDVANGTCAELEKARREHNGEVSSREHRDVAIALGLGVLVAGTLIVGLATSQ